MQTPMSNDEALGVRGQLARILTVLCQQTSRDVATQCLSSAPELRDTLHKAIKGYDLILCSYHLTRLPLELWSTLREYVQVAMGTSLENRSKLFRELTLRLPEDVLYLRTILSSKLSRNLRPYIHHITIICNPRPTDVATCLKMLPSLITLRYGSNRALDWNSHTLLHWRHNFRNLPHLKTLSLGHHNFPSLSALLRLISAPSNLSELELHEVTCPNLSSDDHLPLLIVKPGTVLYISLLNCLKIDMYRMLSATIVGRRHPSQPQHIQTTLVIQATTNLLRVMQLFDIDIHRRT